MVKERGQTEPRSARPAPGISKQQGAAPERVRWTQAPTAAELVALQRTAGNAAVNALLRARRDPAKHLRQRTLARQLIVGGLAFDVRRLTDEAVGAALALLDLEPEPDDEEIRAVAGRLRQWAAAPAPPGGNANWASLKHAAHAVIEGLARIDEGTDDDAGVDALNEIAVRPSGPVGRLLLEGVAGLIASVPHSAGTFSEGSAAVVPTEAERALSFAYFYPPETVRAASRQLLQTTMLSVADMSSCHFSAEQLEWLLGTPPVEDVQVGQTRRVVQGEDLRPPAAALDRTIRELAATIRSSAERGPAAVFNIKYASHSFTVVTTLGSVEVLQSFAGGQGYPLGTGISRGQQFAPDVFEPLLIGAMVPNEIPAVNADSRAQRTLFGGSVFDEEDFTWPLVALRIRRCALRSAEEIAARAKARATPNLEAYRTATEPDRPSRTAKKQIEKEEKRKKEMRAVHSGRVEKKTTKTREKKKARGTTKTTRR